MRKNMFKKLLFVVLLFIHSLSLLAQDKILHLNDTAMVNPELSPMDAPPTIAKKWNQIHNKFFTMNIGLAIILDHNITIQDDNNLAQVGKIDPATEFRAERFVLAGNLLFFKNPWRYMISANYNGLDAPEGSNKFDFLDWVLGGPFWKEGWLGNHWQTKRRSGI